MCQSEKLAGGGPDRPLTEVEVTRQLSKCGGTHIMHNRFTVTLRRA